MVPAMEISGQGCTVAPAMEISGQGCTVAPAMEISGQGCTVAPAMEISGQGCTVAPAMEISGQCCTVAPAMGISGQGCTTVALHRTAVQCQMNNQLAALPAQSMVASRVVLQDSPMSVIQWMCPEPKFPTVCL